MTQDYGFNTRHTTDPTATKIAEPLSGLHGVEYEIAVVVEYEIAVVIWRVAPHLACPNPIGKAFRHS